MSLNNLYNNNNNNPLSIIYKQPYGASSFEPFPVSKSKLRVHYQNEIENLENDKNSNEKVGSKKPIGIPKAASSTKLYLLAKNAKDAELQTTTTTPPTYQATTPPSYTPLVKRFARTPCDQCGYHNIPIMTHPISPLAKSQTNLEFAEGPSTRQSLLSPASAITFGGHMSNMNRNNSGSAQTLQISRRPSLLLQDILTRRASGLFGRMKKDGQNGHTPKSPNNMGSLQETATGSMVTINTGGGDGAKTFQAKQFKEKNRRQGNDAISAALSAVYCKFLVLLGVCLPITEVISSQVPTYIYQGFYVYLYSISILFVVFLYISALRNRTLFNALKDFHERNSNVHLKRKVVHFGSFYLRVGAIAFAIGTMVYSGLEFGQFFELNGQPGCRDIFVAITPICRMLLCICQIQFIFLNTTYLDMARHKVTCRFGLMHMVATNLCEWLYVLVEETKHEIFHIGHHDKNLQNDPIFTSGPHGGVDWTAVNASLQPSPSFGHQAAAAVVKLSNNTLSNLITNVTSITTAAAAAATNQTGGAAQHVSGCTRTDIMGSLVQEVAPFLFPCTIEYSLICAVILYEMWKTVKSIPDIDRTRKSSMRPSLHHAQQKPAHQFSVDCSQSHKGLFFGILVIVITIISIIMYFVLFTQPGFQLIATQEVTLWETVMYFFCGTAIVVGMIVMRDLKYVQNASDEHHSMALDNLLLIVAQTGVYLYGMFSIFGSYFSKWDTVPDRIEGIVGEVFSLAQTSLQTMFILHTSHRRCKGAKQVRRKPGREIITFLLIANIAIWFVNTLIKGRAVFRETHLEFFGVWGWTIITHISMPLAIFYRFHSTICLFEVWKVTYKSSKTH